MASLIWKTPDGKSHTLTISTHETVIGRDPGCAVILEDARASRRHCSILRVEKSFILQDLGSRNGTRVDHELTSRCVLQDGAKITIGKTMIDFNLSDNSRKQSLITDMAWDLPEDWSKVEAIVEVSINPLETVLLEKQKESQNIGPLQQAHSQLEVFYNINSLLCEIRNIDELLSRLLEEVFRVFPAEQGFIFLHDKKSGIMKPIAARRVTEKIGKSTTQGDTPKKKKQDLRKIVVSNSILDQVMREKKALLIHDAGMDERFSKAESVVTVHLRSAMCVPFLIHNAVVGIIQVSTFSRKDAFSEGDLKLLTVIANQTSVWLENIELYLESQRKVIELSSLFEIGKAISNNLVLRDVLDLIMSKSLELIGAETGSIMLMDDTKQHLKIKASVGLSKEIVDSVTWKIGEGVAGWVAQHGQPLLLKDEIVDTRFQVIKRVENIKDALSVPLVIGGDNGSTQIIGVLNVNNKKGEMTFDSADLNLLSAFADQAAIAIENARLYSSLSNVYLNTVKAFASAIEARDPYTSGHCDRLSGYAISLGYELGMSPAELEALRGASLLHDVGKIGIREEILQKSIALTPEEYENMKHHPAIGKQILESIPAMKDILPLIYHHQERFDGSGYPDGLKGEQIPFGARIIAVVDAFDAMTSNRPYRKQLPLKKAIKELKDNSGTQFDPVIVKKFIELIDTKGWGETQAPRG